MEKIFSNRLFISNLVADLLSNFGVVLYYMALMTYVIALPKANFALAIVSLSETLPTFSRLFTYHWADKSPDKVRGTQLTLLFRIVLFILLGCIMRFDPALWIVLVAAIFNFLADMAGQYENGLYIPISLRVVSDEDRQEFMGFSQSIGMAAMILFQSSGAILITWMSFSQLAFFNALTFLIPFFIITANKSRIEKRFAANPLPTIEKKDENQHLLASMKSTLVTAISALKTIPDIRMSMVVILILNALLSSLSVLLTLMMSQVPNFILISPTTTLATLTITMMVGNILGGILTMNLLKNMSIMKAIRASVCLTCLMLGAFALGNIYLMLVFLLPIGILAGAINPKFDTLIYNQIPEEQLTTIIGGISTYFQLGMVGMQVILSGLVLILSAKTLALVLLLLSLLTLGYTMRGRNLRK